MNISASDRAVLRDLARKVRDIASLPIQGERIQLWKRHNSLQPCRPMLLVYPEGAWRELILPQHMGCQGKEAQQIEWDLRHRIYQHEHFDCDNVVVPEVTVQKVIKTSGWGIEAKRIHSTEALGSWKFDPTVTGPEDLKKLTQPRIEYDEPATMQRLNDLKDLFGDILDVRLRGISHISYHLMAQWTYWRGLEQTMMDMVEEPQFLHDAMAILTQFHKEILKQYIALNLLDLNNDNTYHSSGGNGWTDELPKPGFDGKHVRPCDMWASAESQELAEVSPCMHAKFALKYESELLKPFALTGYGCCEALHNKMDDVLKLPGIRRISMSPWANLPLSAQRLGRKAIFSWKPMPAMLVGSYNEDHIRQYIRTALEQTRGCVFEMVLKDTHTVESRPERMDRWLQIAREEITRFQNA